ncbi:MAG: CHAT domain-containing protein [Blastocatellia bacterium]|nr:CHAT domain-containing protein [Blastocatellia bacterium]
MPSGLFRVIGLCLLGWLMSHATAAAQEVGQSAPYDFQSPLARDLKGGEKHSYPITLKANDYVKVVVDQQGIDVVVRLVGPDGKLVQEVNTPIGPQGLETLAVIVELAETYHLEIASVVGTAAPGAYEVRLEEVRPATELDHARLRIEKLNTKARKLLLQDGKYAEALPLARQAVEQSEKIMGPEHELLADCLNTLAGCYLFLGESAQAAPYLVRALAIKEKILGPDHPAVARIVGNLGTVYRSAGVYAKAEPLYLRTLATKEKKLGPEHVDFATDCNNLAALYNDMGEYAKAEPLYQRALAIWEKKLGPDSPDVALVLTNLGNLYHFKGDYLREIQFQERALAIREKVLGPDHPDVALSLNNLATAHQAKADYPRAEALYLRALSINEKNLGPDHPLVGLGYDNLAVLRFEQGDFKQAEELYKKGLTIREKALAPDHPDLATSYENLGSCLLSKGNPAPAEPYLLKALKIRETSLGADHPLAARTLASLSRLFQIKGEASQSVAYRTRANEVSERDLIRNLVAGSEQQKLLYLKQTAKRTDQTISLNLKAAPRNPEAAQAALTVLLRRKGRALDALATSIETLRRQQNPEIQRLLDTYASLASQISLLSLRGPGERKPAEYLAQLRALEEQKEGLENEIGQRSKEFQAQIVPITLQGIQQQLPADAVLLEYGVYQPYDPKTDTYGPARYAAYTLNQQGTINAADLGETRLIDQSVTRFRQVLSNPRSKNVKAASQAVERLVLAPLRSYLGKAEHVLISPDGSLSLIPFAALQNGKGTYLTEQYRLTYLTSGRDLLRLAVKVDSKQPPLVMADPDFAAGKGPVLVGQQYAPLPRLMGTIYEGAALKVLFPTADLKMEGAATAQAVKNVQRPILLHIATHGYFLEDAPQPPAQTGERALLRDITLGEAEKLKVENPLLRAWLFFAGANQGDREPGKGTMTALELAQLDLWGTKLVTLSACKTGVGEAKNGDGVYGLRRALVLAGSESQMMSLWSVSDQATRELMVDYYDRLKNGEGRSDALRNAQRSMLKDPKRQHPYYWAAFIQSGEWATLAGDR